MVIRLRAAPVGFLARRAGNHTAEGGVSAPGRKLRGGLGAWDETPSLWPLRFPLLFLIVQVSHIVCGVNWFHRHDRLTVITLRDIPYLGAMPGTYEETVMKNAPMIQYPTNSSINRLQLQNVKHQRERKVQEKARVESLSDRHKSSGSVTEEKIAEETFHHDLSYTKKQAPSFMRTCNGYRGRLLDTPASSLTARERHVRIAITEEQSTGGMWRVPETASEKDPNVSVKHHKQAQTTDYIRSEPSVTIDRDSLIAQGFLGDETVEAELKRAKSELDNVKDAAWQDGHHDTRQRTSHCYGPTHGVTMCGKQGFQLANNKADVSHEAYRPEGHKHRLTTYELFKNTTAEREAQLAANTKSPAGWIDIPEYRQAVTPDVQVVQVEPAGGPKDGTELHSTWKCPGKLDAMNFNYYDEDSALGADAASYFADGKLAGSDLSCFHINYNRQNRTSLLPPGSKARKDKIQRFNF